MPVTQIKNIKNLLNLPLCGSLFYYKTEALPQE